MKDMKKFIKTTIREFLNENTSIFNPHKFNSFSELTEQDLYDMAKWGLENEYSSSGCWDDSDNLEDAIKCAVDDFKLFLSKPYPIELGNIPRNPIIYRLVRLKTINDLRKNELGNSWFSNPNQIHEEGFFQMLDYLKPFKHKDGQVYIIKGQINIDNIDMKRTLWERSTQWWENEIVVIDDSNIKIISIEALS